MQASAGVGPGRTVASIRAHGAMPPRPHRTPAGNDIGALRSEAGVFLPEKPYTGEQLEPVIRSVLAPLTSRHRGSIRTPWEAAGVVRALGPENLNHRSGARDCCWRRERFSAFRLSIIANCRRLT